MAGCPKRRVFALVIMIRTSGVEGGAMAAVVQVCLAFALAYVNRAWVFGVVNDDAEAKYERAIVVLVVGFAAGRGVRVVGDEGCDHVV